MSGIWSSLFVSGVKWLAGRNNLRDHLKDQLGERVATGRMCNVSQGGEVQWIPDTGFHSLNGRYRVPWMPHTVQSPFFDFSTTSSDSHLISFVKFSKTFRMEDNFKSIFWLRLSQIADLINLNICSSSRGDFGSCRGCHAR